MKSFWFIMLFLVTGVWVVYAQLGVKAGVNLANEIKTFSPTHFQQGLSTTKLTGYQIGLVYQAMPKKSGIGAEIGALLSQKGSAFFTDSTQNSIPSQGYTELTYVEVPFNIRYRANLRFVSIFLTTGLYGAYALSAKTVNETTKDVDDKPFRTVNERLDYGFNVGGGIELFNKVQLGLTWSEGLKNTVIPTSILPSPTTTTNRVFTINLVYLLK